MTSWVTRAGCPRHCFNSRNNYLAGAEPAPADLPTSGSSIATVAARATASGETSYTRKLLDKGAEHCAKKLGEEAVETVIAAVENDRDHLIAESADLLFHLLVLLKARGVTLEEVEAALGQRTNQSGLEEKAARKRD